MKIDSFQSGLIDFLNKVLGILFKKNTTYVEMENQNSIDSYFSKHRKWELMLRIFHELAVAQGLIPETKWSRPVYTLDGKNIIGTGGFKEHCGIWFFQGALLEDEQNLLTNVQEGKTQAMRQMKFHAGDKIDKGIITKYFKEAILNHKKGLSVKPAAKVKIQSQFPVLLKNALSKNKALSKAYYELTPYKQNEYAEYISDAKQDKTKTRRLEKILPMILAGIGLNDKYRK